MFGQDYRLHISVVLGDTNTAARHSFHCVACGKVMSEVNGQVIMITRGDVQPELHSRAVVVRCKHCKTDFSFL